MSIVFHKEDIEVKLPNETRLILWLSDIAKEAGSNISSITYIFCSDSYILDINKEYLQHDYYTDIITFPYNQGKNIESDIFISIDTIKSNSIKYNVPFEQELLRVIAHGLLHLIGYNDKTEEDQIAMTIKENACLEKWESI